MHVNERGVLREMARSNCISSPACPVTPAQCFLPFPAVCNSLHLSTAIYPLLPCFCSTRTHILIPPNDLLVHTKTSSRFTSKRPETPQEVRGYYPRNSSPSHRVSSGVGGGGGAGGGRGGSGATSGVRGGFFPVSKSNSLF